MKKVWKKYRKWIIVGVIILLMGGIVYKNIVTPPQGMTTAKVERKTLTSVMTANGVVAAKKSADLKFNLPGKLVWLGVKDGDIVKAYQAVASLDQRLLQKDLEKALSLYMTTRYDFDTTQNDTYEGEVLTDIIQRELGKSQFALDRSVIAVEVADIAKREASLVSPIAGTVVTTNKLVPGVNLSGADLEKKTIRVADLSTLYFDAKVDEVDFGKVIVGQEAVVELDAFPGKTCSGSVRYVASEGVESTGGVVTIPIEVTLTGCDTRMAIGLNGEARLTLAKIENTLVIPKKYIMTKDGSSSVYVQTGDSFRQRELKKVMVGTTSTTDAEITDGLSEGDTILFLPNAK